MCKKVVLQTQNESENSKNARKNEPLCVFQLELVDLMASLNLESYNHIPASEVVPFEQIRDPRILIRKRKSLIFYQKL
jgi:hypothetical protein